MLIVHFYNNTEKVYSVYANSLKDVKDNPKAYYPQTTEDTIITLEDFKHPVLEKGILREMTREEMVENEIPVSLEEGEKVENKKLIKLEKPSQFHSWNGQEWIADLEQAKKEKKNKLKEIRDLKIYENLDVKGAVFQVRKQDLEKFFLKKIEADFNPELKERKENWILADDSFKAIDFNDIQDIFQAFGERQRKLFQRFGKLSIQLQQAQTWEEIENITWE
ncbi:hypothetical protein ACEXAJ_11300 [Fusobacterium necrophorum subsp. funduliforme]